MKLLLATDGSTFSAAATQAVIAGVKRDGVEIRVVHVVDTRRDSLSQVSALDTEVMNAPAQRRSAEALVEETAERLRAAGHKTTTVVVWGDPRSKIIEAAREWRADLIVLGSHGRTGLNGFLIGSVSDAVAHHAPCSVEIVRAPKGQPKPQGLRILLAMDDSESSEAAANAVIAQAKSEGAEVKLMTVLDPYTVADPKKYPDFAGAVAKLRDQAIQKLLKTAEKFQTVGFKVTEALVEEGDPRDVILDYAEQWRAGLIVVGSHGRKGIKRLLMGSVSEAVSRYAACSVEIVRLRCDR
jgi:nucleotide-binding universal stress UspA family protein